MLSFQINQQLISFLRIIEAQEYLRKNLLELARMYDIVVVDLSYFLAKVGEVNSDVLAKSESSKFDEQIQQVIEVVRSIRASQIYSEISIISRTYWEIFASQDTVWDSLPSAMRHFSDTYDEYLNSVDTVGKKGKLLQVLGAAKSLYFSLSSVKHALSTVQHNYQNISVDTDKRDKVLSILIESEMDVPRFINKINALNIIYVELCNLSDVSITENPLRINKIEAGSLWAEVLGYPKIIEMLESMLEGSISYFYRTFTREGKIASIPRKVESIESVLELRKKLKAIGVNTDELDENLQKASVIIAEETNRLLAGEPRITINGRVFSIGRELEKKYLEAGSKLYLPSADGE